MGTLSNLTDLRVGVSVNIDGQPYRVMWADFMRTAQRKPVMRTKLKNLVSGAVLEKTFKPGDKVEEADLEQKKASFQYAEGDTFNFMDNESFDQFTFQRSQIGDIGNFVKEGSDVDVLYFNSKPVSVSLKPKVELQVIDAPPGVKGDTAGNVTKKVIVETGYEVAVPMFINKGETIRINTDSGEYVERVNG